MPKGPGTYTKPGRPATTTPKSKPQPKKKKKK